MRRLRMKHMRTPSHQPDGHQKSLKQNTPTASEKIDTTVFVRGEMDHVTPRNILQLQRLIGNQRVQRLMPVQQVAHSSTRIQRAEKDDPTQEDKGLMESDAPERFVKKIFAFTRDPQNAKAD